MTAAWMEGGCGLHYGQKLTDKQSSEPKITIAAGSFIDLILLSNLRCLTALPLW
jgi:hypothetical protein